MPSTISASRKRVFGSVFPPAYFTTAPASRLASAKSPPQSEPAERIDDQEQYGKETWDRAWRVATEFLQLPSDGLADLMQSDDGEFLQRWRGHSSFTKEVKDALDYLILPLAQGESLATEQQSILEWYRLEIRVHFLRNFHEVLAKVSDLTISTMMISLMISGVGLRGQRAVTGYCTNPRTCTAAVLCSLRGVLATAPEPCRPGTGAPRNGVYVPDGGRICPTLDTSIRVALPRAHKRRAHYPGD